MAVYKRGGVWWYSFMFRGQRVQESTKQGSKRTAEQLEAAKRTALAKGEVGIQPKKPVPTLKDFAPRFTRAIELQCAEKPRTVQFYRAKLARLLASELSSTRLDSIDEAAIEAYKQSRSMVQSRRKRVPAPATINRELATLRRLLRLAQEWKVIQRVPRIRLLRGEKIREFVLSHIQEPIYLAACPKDLQEVATLLLDTGLRVGEAITLEWPQVRLEPAKGARFGYLTVLSGKAKSKKSRNVPLSPRVVEILKAWQGKRCKVDGMDYVFHRENGAALSLTWLDQQHMAVREALNGKEGFFPKLPGEFVLHSLRHTFGTRLGESGADAFTII